MKLPGVDKAIVPEKKLTEYLLSETHAVGRFKARFFRSLGFNETNVELLQKEILNLANSNNIEDIEQSDYGTKYILEGAIKTPIGKGVKIKTVWIIEKGKSQPIFITAYPA